MISSQYASTLPLIFIFIGLPRRSRDFPKGAIDWSAGFYVDCNDREALIGAIDELAARWNLRIDWEATSTTRTCPRARMPCRC
ncbi:hypothetical protein XALC_2951 [Xanthomonas albilineans GPE PC73]|uniref:Uncharacterized protein n=1 Tax=Xanthomonas albilineans (strain GPE PC73 / CFBP 7063) TaxID=380358 RepID=D2UGB7_XANAP|nr:hypothetical protein XaFJ1_GM002968 [Xanthomonas albilineans]CBA17428.1 hypothetical protein XALC_2951 [Xanthomonas albilineans GPE PC73]